MIKLVPPWAHHYDEFWNAIRRRNLWFIKLRYSAVVMLAVLLFASELFLGISFTEVQWSAIILITSSILLYNVLFHVLRRFLKHEAGSFNPLHLSLLQMISDLTALFLLVYYTGSIETPLYMLFVFHMIIGSLILPGFIIYSASALVVLGFGLIVFLEYTGAIPHQHINGITNFEIYNNFGYTISFYTVFAFVMFMSVVLANRIANQLYKREQQLVTTIEKLNAAEIEKQKYIMGVVHEIKTPLAAVHAYIELILQKFLGPLSDKVEEKLKRAVSRSDEAIELINSVLKISNLRLLDTINTEEFDIYALINEVVAKQAPNADMKGIKIKFEDKREEKKNITADKFLIQIAVSNLVNNAIKYIENEGSVELVIRSDERNLIIEVCDNGVGIPESEQEKIFQDFYRATNIKKSEKEGSGLGLSVVKQIVERHNGNIKLQSPSRLSMNGNAGSCFIISLPY